MVTVVQLVEHQVVILGVAGSSPVGHPKTLNPEILKAIAGKISGFSHSRTVQPPTAACRQQALEFGSRFVAACHRG